MNLPPEMWMIVFMQSGQSKIKAREWRLVARSFEAAWRMWPGGEEKCHSLLAARLLENWRCCPILVISHQSFLDIPYKVRIEEVCESLPGCFQGEVHITDQEKGYLFLCRLLKGDSFGREKILLTYHYYSGDNGLCLYQKKTDRQLTLRNCAGLYIRSQGMLIIEKSQDIVLREAKMVEIYNSEITIERFQKMKAQNSTLIFPEYVDVFSSLRAQNCKIYGGDKLEHIKKKLQNCEFLENSTTKNDNFLDNSGGDWASIADVEEQFAAEDWDEL